VKLTGKLSETFIPKFRGNQDQPESEQIRVQIQHPTLEDRELLSSDITYKDGQNGPEIQVKTKHCKIVGKCVGTVENLETAVDGKIESGKALIAARDPRLEGLVEEIALYIKNTNTLDEVAEKN